MGSDFLQPLTTKSETEIPWCARLSRAQSAKPDRMVAHTIRYPRLTPGLHPSSQQQSYLSIPPLRRSRAPGVTVTRTAKPVEILLSDLETLTQVRSNRLTEESVSALSGLASKAGDYYYPLCHSHGITPGKGGLERLSVGFDSPLSEWYQAS